MKKIGTTSSGTVIVEMTAAHFEALCQLQGSSKEQSATPECLADRVAYVRERIAKLSPKKRDGVVRSILAMFQFTGGIPESQVEEIIGRLVKAKFFTIDERGHVTYKNG
jgi:hypothetical protein